MNNETFDFSVALRLLKEGNRLSRLQFGTTCYIQLKRIDPVPSYTGVIQENYIEMVKRVKLFADNLPESERVICFPFFPSSESILADDWYVMEGQFTVK